MKVQKHCTKAYCDNPHKVTSKILVNEKKT